MVFYIVDSDTTYKVTATTDCTIHSLGGEFIANCVANSSVTFKTPNPCTEIQISDDNAVLSRITESNDLTLHASDSSTHFTGYEKESFKVIADNFGTCLNHCMNSDGHVQSYDRTLLDNLHQQFPDGNITLGGSTGDVTPTPDDETISGHLGDSSIHIAEEERELWNSYQDVFVSINQGISNAVLITDTTGKITTSTVISVSELNTLNNNYTQIVTKLEDLEARLAALEQA